MVKLRDQVNHTIVKQRKTGKAHNCETERTDEVHNGETDGAGDTCSKMSKLSLHKR